MKREGSLASDLPIVEVSDLCKQFGRRKILNGVNLKVFPGDFLTIFGSNGAGKTTFLRILSTLILPSSGQVKIDGFGLKDESEQVRSRIGLISHNSYLYPDLTAYENLRFYGKLFAVSDPEIRISELLELVELEHRKYDLVRTFSCGMQQRLSIARALLHEAPILFMDEPYSGLDARATEILDKVLIGLREEDRTFILTTHDFLKGLEVCSRVAILNKGTIGYEAQREQVDVNLFPDIYRKCIEAE
jgi:heme exporter protein A